jgi:hypothetical protein
MARTRLLKPGFFSNDLLAECDPLARLLFAGLWTLVDRDGRVECRPAKIKAQVLPYDECDVTALLAQLADRKFVQVYAVDSKTYIQVNGFTKHQNPHPKETSDELPEPPKTTGETQSHGNSVTSNGNSGTSRAFSLLPSPLSLNPSLHPSGVGATGCGKPHRRPADPLRFSLEHGWEGIEEHDRKGWAKAYPGCDIDLELAQMEQWLRADWASRKKVKWRSFVVRWLASEQDKGGSRREQGRRPEDRPPPKAWRDQYRPAQYRTPKESAALAASLKLTEEEA